MTHPVEFDQITAERPELASVEAEYDKLRAAWDAADGLDARLSVVKAWDALTTQLETWMSLTHLRFHQDTRDPEANAARDFADEIEPKLTRLAVDVKRAILSSPHRAELEEALGGQAFVLWEADAAAFEPKLQDDLVLENKLNAEYVALKAAARVTIQGEEVTLAQVPRFASAPERAVRQEAAEALWGWAEGAQHHLDRIYADMVQVRTRQARALGHETYTPLGYLKMQRSGYTAEDVARFRRQIVERVVPVAAKLSARQAETLGVDPLMVWDEAIFDPSGNPKPAGDHDWMLDRAVEMFDRMGEPLASFFRMMNDGGFLDLKAREGKAGGGFCTSFPSYGTPFIFANFNGTKNDVEVFTHEAGHAFQNWMSRSIEPSCYHWPTYEACEIHSMSLEFLTWPHMELFFGDDAERFRQVHLTGAVLFLPYGACVDHFQHWVYANPDATTQERRNAWSELEATYMPWRKWGHLDHPATGARWHLQTHIFTYPFYYIDYALAQACALQFWDQSQRDPKDALERYVALCSKGGSGAFLELVDAAGLRSPFEDGCLDAVMERVEAALGL